MLRHKTWYNIPSSQKLGGQCDYTRYNMVVYRRFITLWTDSSKNEENAFPRYSQKSKNYHHSSLQYQIEIKLCEHDNHGNKMITRSQ